MWLTDRQLIQASDVTLHEATEQPSGRQLKLVQTPGGLFVAKQLFRVFLSSSFVSQMVQYLRITDV